MVTDAQIRANAIAAGLAEMLDEEELSPREQLDTLTALLPALQVIRLRILARLTSEPPHDTIPCPPPTEQVYW